MHPPRTMPTPLALALTRAHPGWGYRRDRHRIGLELPRRIMITLRAFADSTKITTYGNRSTKLSPDDAARYPVDRSRGERVLMCDVL